LGQRSRKRGRREPPPAAVKTAPLPAAGDAPARPSRSEERNAAVRPSRSEERNAAVRATLKPFADGERPWSIKISVAVAFLLGAVNFVLFVAGTKPNLGGQQPHLAEILIFCGLMLVCAAGVWRMRYWAVLGFQTLLAIGLLGFSLALIRASSVLGAAICLAVIVPGGILFYKLVRILGRLQLPAPPRR
jgi:hypothetical protein